MRTRHLIRLVLCGALGSGLCSQVQDSSAAQGQRQGSADSPGQADTKSTGPGAQATQAAAKLDEIIDRFIKREHDQTAAFDLYSPVIETYIQEVNLSPSRGTVPKADYYFLGQADFRGWLKVHTMTEGGKKGSFLWSFNPAGFLQMVYIDRGEFDTVHYRFKYSGREFLGDVRCLIFDVSPAPKVRGARFVGRI